MSHRSLKTPAPHSVLGIGLLISIDFKKQSAVKVTANDSPGRGAATR